MDWDLAGSRDKAGSIAQMLFDAMRHLGETARRLNDIGVCGRAMPCVVGDPAVLAFTRDDGPKGFMLLANMSDRTVSITLPDRYSGAPDILGLSDDEGDVSRLPPYAVRWIVEA
jgi:hypothetical protein